MNTAEDFLTLVNKLVQFILAHHKTASLPNNPDDKLPPFLVDAEKYLIRIINPSTPSEDTTLAAHHNAQQWIAATLTLLQDHYRRIRERVIAEITPLLVPAWNRALLVAIRQARRKSPSIRECSIEATRVMLSDIMATSFPMSDPTPNTTRSSVPGRSQASDISQDIRAATPQNSDLDTATLPSTPTLETADGVEEHPQPPLSPVITIVRPNPALNKSLTKPLLDLSPPPTTPEPKKAKYDIDSLEDGYLRSLLDDYPLDVPPPNLTPIRNARTVPTPTPPKPSGSLRNIPLYTNHPHNGDKYKNWTLSPRRPLIIMGDSNLARLPLISDVRIQVDSFPGAKLAHATNILRHKTNPCPMVTSAILSFGINDKESSNPSLLRKSIGSLYNAAKTAFPNAVIYMPLLNCSDGLPSRIQKNVDQFNELVKSYNSFIPRLSKTQFHTIRDNIHWTPETARLMSNHWKDFLE